MLLQPKNLSGKKRQKKRLKGKKRTSYNLRFGTFGIKCVQSGWISPNQLESVRKIISKKIREINKGFKGKIWIRIFPHKPVISKPKAVRMGKGKGSIKSWVCPVKAGQTVLEWEGPLFTFKTSFELYKAIKFKFPLKTVLISQKNIFDLN